MRFRLKFGLALASAVAATVTAVWPDWIELVFHWSPDHGSGDDGMDDRCGRRADGDYELHACRTGVAEGPGCVSAAGRSVVLLGETTLRDGAVSSRTRAGCPSGPRFRSTRRERLPRRNPLSLGLGDEEPPSEDEELSRVENDVDARGDAR